MNTDLKYHRKRGNETEKENVSLRAELEESQKKLRTLENSNAQLERHLKKLASKEATSTAAYRARATSVSELRKEMKHQTKVMTSLEVLPRNIVGDCGRD